MVFISIHSVVIAVISRIPLSEKFRFGPDSLRKDDKLGSV